jgi:fused signal recognition particle receptor
MADNPADKPGFLSRLFGRKPEPEDVPKPSSGSEPVPSRPASAPDDLAGAARAASGASPDIPSEDKLPPELAGADLQPIETIDRDGGGSKEPVARAEPAASAQASKGWWQRLRDGMRRTSSSLSDSVTSLFTKRRLDAETLEDLEDALVKADLGVETALRIAKAVGEGRYDKEISPEEVKGILAGEVEEALKPVARPLSVNRERSPFVILMVGVNGSGKTTTIGKLAQKYRQQGLKVMLAAGDTFRAAAIEQLKIWGERVGAPVIAREQGADAAGLAFDALNEARAKGMDVLLIDTAGRLQNKAGLMAELEKIVRVIRKFDESAPHATLLVLDATVGQNALSQVELFRKAADVSGLVMTKLDGTARGGILVALAAKFGLPVHFIGVGEGVEDLEPFAARDFARAIAGLET